MKHQVLILQEAEDDIFELCKHILTDDSRARAVHVYDKLREKIESPVAFPERGHLPPELERVGVTGFREIRFKPYGIIYEVTGQRVFVHAVLDGRRDLQDLLERRLFR